MFVAILAAIAAIPKIVEEIQLLTLEVKRLRQEAIDKELDQIRKDVNETLIKIQGARSNDERAALVRELNQRISK